MPVDDVLVIDDSPLALSIARDALEAVGFRVRTAHDGAEGLGEIAHHPPDVVLCDLQMPVMDGFQVLSEMQRYSPTTPVLIFTDASEVHKAVEAMKLGAASYVLKGVSDQELVDEVRSALVRRRESEKRRQQKDQLATIGTLAAGVAHEINNPIAYVASNLAFVRSSLEAPGDTTPQELIEAIREAEQGLARVKQIVRDIKSLSRTDEQRVPVDLEEVLESAARMAGPAIRMQARLVVDLRQLPVVLGDAGRLCQVFINLLVNAAQSISPGGPGAHQISLMGHRDAQGAAIIEVRDTGAGMSAEVKGRLFEPFFTTKAAGIGTGLGLSICQSIVIAHGGTISVESEPELGSTFCVRLPGGAGPS